MNTPADLRYTKEHEWVRLEGEFAVVGITDYAQDALGDIVFVELPEVGANYNAGDTLGVVESVKAVSDVYAPISGEVVAVNEDLPSTPEVINSEPYGGGWLAKFKLSNPAEVQDLMDAAAYEKFVAEEHK